MGRTRHKNPRTAMRHVKPGAEAIAKVTEVWHLAAALTAVGPELRPLRQAAT
ncbi:hypothetical protein [Nonomuraea sp. CA-141351]|uniref:hypothetical protein n=1 Tax=Nonomuraea sp. CA-141351 TaxID=3239996 RepID=UPI003D8F1985